MLIHNAALQDGTLVDLRIDGASVSAIGTNLPARPGETLLDARGGALLPGLHDHHLHLMALATSLESLRCGPPDVSTAEELGHKLAERAAIPIEQDQDWIRGIGYHESVAGEIDRCWLDRVVPSRPVRIQHRSGRLWIINSQGLERLCSPTAAATMTQLPQPEELATGRIFDADSWLRERLGGPPPSLGRASAVLASHGITGVTDASARNTCRDYGHFVEVAARGGLLQRLVVMGDASLDTAEPTALVRRGPTKIYLREAGLPAAEQLFATIARS
ncbi:MAG: amidohydrolase family protein, partial [Dehalococcoidia bacterium]|nr:amidohydrolase family protein [Dehalococcoidia bacterium]